jgi:hypothetical protein
MVHPMVLEFKTVSNEQERLRHRMNRWVSSGSSDGIKTANKRFLAEKS